MACLQTRESKLRPRRNQVIAHHGLMLQKLIAHHDANGMLPVIVSTRIALPIAIKPGKRLGTTSLQHTAQYILNHSLLAYQQYRPPKHMSRSGTTGRGNRARSPPASLRESPPGKMIDVGGYRVLLWLISQSPVALIIKAYKLGSCSFLGILKPLSLTFLITNKNNNRN
jgi:hypothetical protein